jgi:hypothetical protein
MNTSVVEQREADLLLALLNLTGRMHSYGPSNLPSDPSITADPLTDFRWELDQSTPRVYRKIYRFKFAGSNFRLVLSDEQSVFDLEQLETSIQYSQIDLHQDDELVASGRMTREIDENGIGTKLRPHKLLYQSLRGSSHALLELTSP